MESYFNLWVLGDRFLKSVFNEYRVKINECKENKKMPRPYIQEYYNVLPYTTESSNDVPAISRIWNALGDAIIERKRLPRFLLVVIDKDIISDHDVFDEHIVATIQESVDWIIHQISITIKRHRLNLMDKRPGAIYGTDPTVIFVRMIRRADVYFR